METMLGLLLVLLAGWAWHQNLQARERATIVARTHCERAGVQLLDETVALRSVRLARRGGRLRIRRHYDFEFSVDGDRHAGCVVMVGLAIEAVAPAFGMPAPDTQRRSI